MRKPKGDTSSSFIIKIEQFLFEIGSICQQGLQEMVLRFLVRIDHSNPMPCEFMVHIFTEKQAAVLLRSHGKNQGVPYLQVVVRCRTYG